MTIPKDLTSIVQNLKERMIKTPFRSEMTEVFVLGRRMGHINILLEN